MGGWRAWRIAGSWQRGGHLVEGLVPLALRPAQGAQ